MRWQRRKSKRRVLVFHPKLGLSPLSRYSELTDGIVQTVMPASDPRFVAGNNHNTYLNLAESVARSIEFKYIFYGTN